MTNTDLLNIQMKLAMQPLQMAACIGVAPKSYYRWINGEIPISYQAETTIRMLVFLEENGLLMQWVKTIADYPEVFRTRRKTEKIVDTDAISTKTVKPRKSKASPNVDRTRRKTEKPIDKELTKKNSQKRKSKPETKYKFVGGTKLTRGYFDDIGLRELDDNSHYLELLSPINKVYRYKKANGDIYTLYQGNWYYIATKKITKRLDVFVEYIWYIIVTTPNIRDYDPLSEKDDSRIFGNWRSTYAYKLVNGLKLTKGYFDDIGLREQAENNHYLELLSPTDKIYRYKKVNGNIYMLHQGNWYYIATKEVDKRSEVYVEYIWYIIVTNSLIRDYDPTSEKDDSRIFSDWRSTYGK